ncbi:S24 family peptidase [Dyadobacter sp. 3J3]|uniref:S24 family peptidase n=1 Tax=Dyadobacter sp. 3J3 TaxID=2606600 RepID=UPI001357A734|nr:S24 family peptidase [Dyadobacter sp. 3J3]
MKKIEKIFQQLELEGLSITEFERYAGISNGYLNNTLSRDSDISAKILDKIRGHSPESYKIIERALGDVVLGSDFVSENSQKLTDFKPNSDLIPYWEIDFIAGTNFDAVDNQSTEPTYYMDIPDFRGCTAFRAYSDSMEGLIKSGSVLFGTKIERWNEHLEYGQVYGIVCDDGRKYLKYIKRFRENPLEYFLLESENKSYDEFEMPKRAIRSIWLIHGHLSKRI